MLLFTKQFKNLSLPTGSAMGFLSPSQVVFTTNSSNNNKREMSTMKAKKTLTRRKASKAGCFDPATYAYKPSPHIRQSSFPPRGPKDAGPTSQLKVGTPIVAICGRPNVGKSSLFNRLVGESKSLITPIPGTTRDRIYGTVEWADREFILVDTGGLLGDTDEWSSDIHQQAQVALGQADLLVLVVDVNAEINRKETELARMVKKLNKPVVVIANKADNGPLEKKAGTFARLGLGEPIAASAIHALGEVTILETITEKLAELGFPVKSEEPLGEKDIRIAIVGKPNAGKSSFLNRVIGEERCVVSPKPGTTTDPVDEHFLWKMDGKEVPITLIDTAGMAKKNTQEKDSLEHLSALWALKVITRAHVCLLLLDSKDGITTQDKRIGSFIVENLSSCLIVFNKWDVIEEAKKGIEKESYTEAARYHLPELKYCPTLFCSAKTGFGVNGAIVKAINVAQDRRKKIRTAKILRILEIATLMKPPPMKRNKRMRIKFASQADTSAPTITLHVNDPDLATDEYTRFLTTRFRNELPTLEGSPLSIVYKKSVGSASYLKKTNQPVLPAQRKKQPQPVTRREKRPKFGEVRKKRKVVVVNYMKRNQKKRKAELESRRNTKERRVKDSKNKPKASGKKENSKNSKKSAKKVF